jgi:hypothetical protein
LYPPGQESIARVNSKLPPSNLSLLQHKFALSTVQTLNGPNLADSHCISTGKIVADVRLIFSNCVAFEIRFTDPRALYQVGLPFMAGN